ncbi:hypothetical protein D0863_06745 [Hortaea werneckii]|uniref:Zn(2)-C6 fungal-type domain-containing protein n=1 Tax=Hortaea werneckii TaxID=91943 RepID=A0A3M7DY39_HORWE|nr:hypothetical protein D0863_06745 [Hortaea werneckii]
MNLAGLASVLDQTAYTQPGLGAAAYVSYDSNTISPTSSDQTPGADHLQLAQPISGHKRKEPLHPSGSGSGPGVTSKKKARRAGPRADSKHGSMSAGDGEKDGDGPNKPKRVRTGCLTCRERHLKCDEGMPHCNNCKKSSRTCKRGVRLNFIDTWVDRPPRLISMQGTHSWKVEFLDESRDIASEYMGGLSKYKALEQEPPAALRQQAPPMAFDFATTAPPAPSIPHQPLPPIQGILPEPYQEPAQTQTQVPSQQSVAQSYETHIKSDPSQSYAMPPLPQVPHSGSTSDGQYNSSAAGSTAGHGSVVSYQTAPTEPSDDERRQYLDSQEETLFIQVFVEEVGLWMDSMDSQKHFSRLLPFHSLGEPMLLNAFLACGARHLTLVNPAYTEEKALHYYDTATRYLLKELQNPGRDTVVCATTAVILNVYEIMSERALQRMNHIAGARALIKECGWNARSQGVGSACFWLNVGLEVLSCLHFNWQVAWDPDDWCLDMDFSKECWNSREEVWTHRMLYLVAKVCNFRATIPRQHEPDPDHQQLRTQERYEEWARIKGWVDAWNQGVPRTMQPLAFIWPHQTSSKSAFPEVWLVKRTTIVARLFYHTAQLLLAQVHPYYDRDSPEMLQEQRHHSQTICGIAAHVKDRGVASVCIRSLAHAAEVLTDRRQQEEVLAVFEKINKETGWRIGFVYKELREKWGWNDPINATEFAQTHTAAIEQRKAQEAAQVQMQREEAQRQQSIQSTQSAVQGASIQQGYQSQPSFGPPSQHQPSMSLPPPQPMQPALQKPPSAPPAQQQQKRPPAGIPNPMYAKADFNLPQHPYQNYYVAPNSGGFSGQQQNGNLGMGGAYYSF